MKLSLLNVFLSFLLSIALIVPNVRAEEQSTVTVGVLCYSLDTMMNDAKKLTQTRKVSPGPDCMIVRGIEVPVLDIIAGPFKDVEGDTFYVVKVNEEPELYTIAWPGFNSTLKKDIKA